MSDKSDLFSKNYKLGKKILHFLGLWPDKKLNCMSIVFLLTMCIFSFFAIYESLVGINSTELSVKTEAFSMVNGAILGIYYLVHVIFIDEHYLKTLEFIDVDFALKWSKNKVNNDEMQKAGKRLGFLIKLYFFIFPMSSVVKLLQPFLTFILTGKGFSFVVPLALPKDLMNHLVIHLIESYAKWVILFSVLGSVFLSNTAVIYACAQYEVLAKDLAIAKSEDIDKCIIRHNELLK